MGLRLLVIAALLAALPPSRDDGWRQDIAIARDDFLQKDRSYPPEARAEARERLRRLSTAVPTLTDQQVVAELARVAALADNAHTRAYLLRNRGWWRRYPIRIWKFADGWHVVAVQPGLEGLLGSRIVRIGGKPVGSAEAAVHPLFAGPPGWRDYMASYSLTSPDALLGTGVIDGMGAAEFETVRDGRRSTIRLEPQQAARRDIPEESWWFLSPDHPATAGWVQLLSKGALPPYLVDAGRWYELRRCHGGLLYLRFSRAEDQPGRATLADFGQGVLAQLQQQPDARLIVDLRFNTGGNLQKTRALFERIAASPTGQVSGRLFVILGPSTFSAGITPAAMLKQDSKATFVGGDPGDHLHFWAEGGNVVLPNSGLILHYADRAHLYGPGGRDVPEELVYLRLNAPSLKPDRPAPMRFSDYRDGGDPSVEAVTDLPLRCEAGPG